MHKIFGSESGFFGVNALVIVAALGCAKSDGPSGEPGSSPADTRSATLGQDDVAPLRVYELAAPPGISPAIANASAPGTPKVAIQPQPLRPMVKVKETMIFVAPGSVATEVPIDDTAEASVYLTPQKVPATAHVMKDVRFFSPSGARLNVRMPRPVDALAAQAPTVTKAGEIEVTNKTKLEAEVPLPVVRFKQSKDKAGTYRLELGPAAAENGLVVEARFPSSSIELDLAPCSTTVLVGDQAAIGIEVLDGTTGIADAAVEAELVGPDNMSRIAAPVKFLGGGKFAVSISEALSARSEPGQYTVFVRAKGSSGGRRFDRFGSTGFSFAVPTARLATVSAPRSIRDGAGMITGFDVDVALEVASFDRYEVSAVLAHLDPDGTERPVALAQSAGGYDHGTHTVTLHFDAGHVRLPGYEGTLVLRSLALFSQGRNLLYHRLSRGLEQRTAKVLLAELAPLTNMTPAVAQMIADGEFDLSGLPRP